MSRPGEYRFCPHCGGGLESRTVKAGEPPRLVCSVCGFVFYLDPKVATGMIVELDGGVVLLRRAIGPAYGKWTAPGGFVNRFETVAQAAIRETWEEACLEVSVEELVGVYSYPDAEVVIIFFAGRHTGGTLRAGDESLEASVFPEEAVPWPDLAFRSTRDALRDYFALRKRDRGGKESRPDRAEMKGS